MKEMLLIGRGGQGVVLASQILADAFARAGYWVQSFPEFKAERRGAPICGFLRWDAAPIRRRYKVQRCDVLVVVSASPPLPETMQRVRPGGLVLLNRDRRFERTGPFEIARVPASAIARRHGIVSSEGRPMGNVAALGACVRLLLPDGLEFLEQAIESRMGAHAAANVLAARDGYERCVRQRARRHDLVVEVRPDPPRDIAAPPFPVSTTTTLANHTGSWSEERPVLDDACSACALCALFCPEGAIARQGSSMAIDYLYCKGCGICEVVCPVQSAIHMDEVKV
jgi:pyruvate ferredoxin oxidoreductase gamma subunit